MEWFPFALIVATGWIVLVAVCVFVYAACFDWVPECTPHRFAALPLILIGDLQNRAAKRRMKDLLFLVLEQAVKSEAR